MMTTVGIGTHSNVSKTAPPLTYYPTMSMLLLLFWSAKPKKFHCLHAKCKFWCFPISNQQLYLPFLHFLLCKYSLIRVVGQQVAQNLEGKILELFYYLAESKTCLCVMRLCFHAYCPYHANSVVRLSVPHGMVLSALLGNNKQKALHFVSALLFIQLLFVSGQKVLANRSVGGGRGEEFEAGDNQVHVLVLKVFHDVGHKRVKLLWRYHRSATKIKTG